MLSLLPRCPLVPAAPLLWGRPPWGRGHENLRPDVVEDMVTVLEFAPTAVASYVYVVLVEPSADLKYGATVEVENPDGATVWWIPSVPGSTNSRGGGSTSYPEIEAGTGWQTLLGYWDASSGGFFEVTSGLTATSDPVVLLTSAPIHVSVS